MVEASRVLLYSKPALQVLFSLESMGKHYVPQKYLRGFAVPEKPTHVWMFDKKTQRWAMPAISDVAQERDYFPEDVERQLTREIENPANVVLDCLRSGRQLDTNDRVVLENYIAVMLMRVPRKRRKGYENFPTVRASTLSRLREEISSSDHSASRERIEQLLNELDRLEKLYEQTVPQNVIEQIHSPWPSDAIIEVVRQMTWRFTPPQPGTFFVTSDNPAYFFEAYGLGSPHAELTFPISSTLALFGSHQGPPGATLMMARVRSAVMKEVNRRMVSGAERFVFTSQRAPWIEVIATKAKPYLSRIIWQ